MCRTWRSTSASSLREAGFGRCSVTISGAGALSPLERDRARIDEALARIDVAPAWIDEAPAWIDVAPAWIDEAPAWIDEAPAWIDEAPAWIETLSGRPPDILTTRCSVRPAWSQRNGGRSNQPWLKTALT